MTKQKPLDNSLRPSLEALEQLYRLFAPRFASYCPVIAEKAPVITIQTRGRRALVGWYKKEGWTRGKETLPEINITAESLAEPLAEIADTVCHEMVHHAHKLLGKKDCSSTQYHNKTFKAGCEAVGLNCERMKGHGWAATSLSDGLRSIVDRAKIDPEAFAMFRVTDGPKRSGPGSGPGSRLKKWTCECGTIIRAAGEIDVRCNECLTDFTCQD